MSASSISWCNFYRIAIFCVLVGIRLHAQIPTSVGISSSVGSGSVATVSVGANITLTAFVVGGPGPFAYVWRKTGVVIAGAMASTYTINPITTDSAGDYTVTVTNASGSLTSNVIAIAVRGPAPVIGTHPAPQTLQAGGTISLSAAALGTPPFFFAWYRFGSLVQSNFVFGNTDTFTKTNAQPNDAGSYTVRITYGSPSEETVSNAALVTITTTPLTITQQPVSKTAIYLNSVIFSVAADGAGSTLNYRWYKDGVSVFSISGLSSSASLTSPNLSIGVVQPEYAGTYTVIVSNSAGQSITSNAVTLTVTSGIAITSQPANQTVTTGSAATFSVATSYSTPLPGAPSYQWQKNGIAIPGATLATLTLPNAQLADAASYSVVAYYSYGGITPALSVTSSAATLTVHAAPTIPAVAPTITTQPSSQTVKWNGFPTLSVVATGTPAPTYQWFKDGVALVGYTEPTINFRLITYDRAGRYSVVVTNSAGSVTSQTADLVIVADFIAPVITVQPVSQNVADSASATFSVTATGTPAPSYQWRKNAAPIAGATNSTYIVTSAHAIDEGSYSVRVYNEGGSIESSTVTLKVSAPTVTVPVLTSQPTAQSITMGSVATFSVSATGTGPLAYQWRKDGVALIGATNSTYTIPSAQSQDAGSYSVVVTNSAGSVTSAAVPLNVTVAAVAPTIATQPTSQSVNVGSSATFTVEASGTAPFSYQWSKNGVAISGATAATYTVPPAQTGDAGNYSVVVTNSVGSVASNSAGLIVTISVIAPIFTAQPSNQDVVAGNSVTFFVTAAGTAPFSYQWFKNANPISGATSSNYVVSSAQAGDGGSYTVVVTNSAGSATSAVAILSVALPPAITTQPVTRTIIAGGAATFFVTATGTAPLSYQWRKDGNAIAGATGPTYTLPAVRDSDAGSFSVVVSNAAGPITSSAAALSVVSFPGTYFGRFNNNPGDRFALVIRADGTALFLGYAASLFTGYTATNIVIKPDGTFTADLTEIKPPAANTPAGDALPGVIDPPSLAAAPLTLSGSVASGQLTGGVTGAALTLAAPKSPATGTAQSSAGVYQTSALNSSTGGLTTIVDPTGAAFVFSQTAAGVSAGTGTINIATGQVTTMLADNSQAITTVNSTSGTATATVTTSAKETLTFSGLAEGTLRTDRLVNIASRGAVSASDLMIAGFVITGSSPKPVMIRATGPALAAFGLGGTLPNPKLELYRGTAKIQENDDWSAAANATEVVATAARTGAFPLTAASADAVLLTTLEPGGYTAQVSSVTGANGVALVEVYDAGSTAVTADTPRLINISTRANVAGGEGLLIAGIVITGNSPKKILIRATGPALAAFGVPGALTDPLLKLYKGDAVLRQNDNWSADLAEAALIAAAGSATGAFALTPGTKDAALLITLEPGAYTAQVSGVAGAAGAALVEVYEVP